MTTLIALIVACAWWSYWSFCAGVAWSRQRATKRALQAHREAEALRISMRQEMEQHLQALAGLDPRSLGSAEPTMLRRLDLASRFRDARLSAEENVRRNAEVALEVIDHDASRALAVYQAALADEVDHLFWLPWRTRRTEVPRG